MSAQFADCKEKLRRRRKKKLGDLGGKQSEVIRTSQHTAELALVSAAVGSSAADLAFASLRRGRIGGSIHEEASAQAPVCVTMPFTAWWPF